MLTFFSVQSVVLRFDMLCLLANVTGLLRLDCCFFFFFLAGLAVMRAGAGLDSVAVGLTVVALLVPDAATVSSMQSSCDSGCSVALRDRLPSPRCVSVFGGHCNAPMFDGGTWTADGSATVASMLVSVSMLSLSSLCMSATSIT